MASKPRPKSKRKSPLKRYFLLIAGITLFWAAANEPPELSAGATLAWLLSAAAVLIVTCSVMSLAEPLFLMVLKAWPQPPPPPPTPGAPDKPADAAPAKPS